MFAPKMYLWEDHFQRAQELSLTVPGQNGWTYKDTSAAGAPTALALSDPNGAIKLLLANTDEAEILTLYQENVLPFDFEGLDSMEFIVKVAAIDAVSTLVMGFATAQDDVPDSVVSHAWLRMEGSVSTTAVYAETDDSVHDNNDIATGLTLGAIYQKYVIDCNIKTDVKFYGGDASRNLKRIAEGTTFDMSTLTGNVQPFFQLQKASGTGVQALFVDYVALRGSTFGT